MINVKRPQKGQRTLQSIFDSVNSIIDYLPTLTVRGDNYSTYVEHSTAGTVVHAKQSVSPDQTGQGGKYYAGSGIAITSGNFINAQLSAGPNIHIDYNNGYFVISGTPSGSGGGPGPDNDTTYTGEYNATGSGWISVDSTGSNPHMISSTLRQIGQLYNYPLVEDSTIVMPNSLTACNNTVDIDQVGQIYNNHFIQTKDILNDGLGTKINLAWMRNPFGDTSDDGTNGIIQGLQVDLTLSGGRFTNVKLHKHVFGAYDPDSGTRYDPPTESTVESLLSGASGIVMDEETNLVSLSADFYNDLMTILDRPSAGNFVLGSLDGTLTWLSTCQCDCDQVGG